MRGLRILALTVKFMMIPKRLRGLAPAFADPARTGVTRADDHPMV
jgi:hypothetical protein